MTNPRQTAVDIRDFRIVVEKRADLPAGMVALCNTGGADPPRDLSVNVDLNPKRPTLAYRSEPEGPLKPMPTGA